MEKFVKKLSLHPIDGQNCNVRGFPTPADFEAVYVDGGWDDVQEFAALLVATAMNKALDYAFDGKVS